MDTGITPCDPKRLYSECPVGMYKDGYTAMLAQCDGNVSWYRCGSQHVSFHGRTRHTPRKIIEMNYESMRCTDIKRRPTAELTQTLWYDSKRDMRSARRELQSELRALPPPPDGWGFVGMKEDDTNLILSWAVLKPLSAHLGDAQ